jgi:hypothetical protein
MGVTTSAVRDGGDGWEMHHQEQPRAASATRAKDGRVVSGAGDVGAGGGIVQGRAM